MQNSFNFVHRSLLSFSIVLKQPKNIRLFSEKKTYKFNESTQIRLQNLPAESQFVTSKMANPSHEFSFDSYDLIGFDLDNCLVRYNVKNMINLEYNCLAEFLVKKGYSKDALLKPLEEDTDFLQKGLILDFEKGNLLRICPGKIDITFEN